MLILQLIKKSPPKYIIQQLNTYYNIINYHIIKIKVFTHLNLCLAAMTHKNAQKTDMDVISSCRGEKRIDLMTYTVNTGLRGQ